MTGIHTQSNFVPLSTKNIYHLTNRKLKVRFAIRILVLITYYAFFFAYYV